MGNLTTTKSGEITTFFTGKQSEIRSLKVHFSPKQAGSGDPSPDNVREIVGWDGVEVNHTRKNIGHIFGYGTQNITDIDGSKYKTTNSYGTKINTTIFNNPDTLLIVEQSQAPNTTVSSNYQNGYIVIGIDNLIFEESYNVSFKVSNITKNLLNTDCSNMRLLVPNGTSYNVNEVVENTLIFKDVKFSQNTSTPKRQGFEIRICGISFTLSEFMVTPVDENNFDFEPYQGYTNSYQWVRLPDEYQEVEYIEGTGEQYITIEEYVGGNKQKYEYSVETNITNITNTYNLLFGYSLWNDSASTCVYFDKNNIQCRRRNGSNTTDNDIVVNTDDYLNKKIKIDIFKSHTSITNESGNNIINNNEVDTLYPSGVYIFRGQSNGNGYTYPCACKIYSYKVYRDDDVVYDLIPCYRKSDNEIGMYDLVSDTFYTNSGTGTFLKGNDTVGEIYGGYVDLISGELVETHCLDKLTETVENLSNDYNTDTRVFFRCQLSNNFKLTKNTSSGDLTYAKCNKLIYTNRSIWGKTDSWINYVTRRYNSTNKICMNMYKDLFGITSEDTLTEQNTKINTYLQLNPIDFVYEIETPITHQLTSQQLQTFIGQNNIWSNADYVEVEYDLIESSDLKKIRRKIIMNSPHVESISGDVASFSTDMKAPLKSCVVNFSPIQEGNGDPSPTNVRNINGWDGVTVGLPSEYQQVEYIESTGTQYINTGIIGKTGLRMTANILYTKVDNDVNFVGSRNNNTRIYLLHSYPSKFCMGYGTFISSQTIINANVKYYIETILYENNQKIIVNNEIVLSGTSSSIYDTELPLFIFALNHDGKISYPSKGRVYDMQLYENNILVRNFIPCYRLLDNEIGLYDTVSQTFFTNQGTGTFIKGEDVNPSIATVNWEDDIGTVYGGYVDLVKGELVAEWVKFVFDRDSKVSGSGTSTVVEGLTWMGLRKTISSALPYMVTPNGGDSYGLFTIGDWQKAAVGGRNRAFVNSKNLDVVLISINGEDLTTSEGRNTFFNYIENNNIPIECIYKLAEPIHYSLTPQQLLSLKGQNNIFSNTNGTTEVKYWTH